MKCWTCVENEAKYKLRMDVYTIDSQGDEHDLKGEYSMIMCAACLDKKIGSKEEENDHPNQ